GWGIGREYRLSEEKSVTPLEAMEDARAAVAWVRTNAERLGIDRDRIAAYGWSAGGQLAAMAATGSKTGAPNALVLVCPAVDVENDSWFKRILLGRTNVARV